MSEDDLLKSAQRGDPVALEELCRREWKPVYALVYRAVQNRVEAQDLTQEVFLRALKSLDRYRDTGTPFRAFLATVARNLLRDRWRRKTPYLVDLEKAHELVSPTDGPEEWALAESSLAPLRQAFGALPSEYQTVIRLRILEARAVGEVATLMGRTPGAIRQLQRRAIVSLRNTLHEGSRV